MPEKDLHYGVRSEIKSARGRDSQGYNIDFEFEYSLAYEEYIHKMGATFADN